ncbi:MAG: response regulator transcription factor [Cyanobacteria bacterium P01_G01_bin.19]
MTTTQTDISTIRILIVDDQNLMRETIQMYLEHAKDIEVVGYAHNGTTAISQIEQLKPNVVILDLEMPGMDGLSSIKAIGDRFPETKILVFSSHEDRARINQAIAAGAKGYLVKGTPGEELANAVRSLNKGYFQLGPGLMEKLVISISNSATENSKTLEEKLIVALKKFKRDTNQQIANLVRTELDKNSGQLGHQLELKMLSYKNKHNELHKYARKIEYRLYLLILFQLLSLFTLAIYWII